MNPDAKTETAASPHEVANEAGLQPPAARREPVEHVLHGDRRVDHYAWLRQKENPDVIAYLEAENVYTDAILRPTEQLQEKLYQEMLGRIQQTDFTVPYRLRGYLYFTRTHEGKQYPLHFRRREAEGSPEELLLDLNQLAVGHSFLALGSLDISDDDRLLAYSLDTTGYRQYMLHVKDLVSGALLTEKIERVTSVAWAADNRSLFYTVEDETTKRSHRLYRHALGSTEPDPLLYEEADEKRLARLKGSENAEIAGLAAKVDREEVYHRMHAQMWHDRLQEEPRYIAALAELRPLLEQRGEHTSELPELWEEMTMVRRSQPAGTKW